MNPHLHLLALALLLTAAFSLGSLAGAQTPSQSHSTSEIIPSAFPKGDLTAQGMLIADLRDSQRTGPAGREGLTIIPNSQESYGAIAIQGKNEIQFRTDSPAGLADIRSNSLVTNNLWSNIISATQTLSSGTTTAVGTSLSVATTATIGNVPPGLTLTVQDSAEIQGAAVDSHLRFHRPGQVWYSLGIDVSDGNKFKIGPSGSGGTLGGTNGIVMETNGNVQVTGTLTATQLSAPGLTVGGWELDTLGNRCVQGTDWGQVTQCTFNQQSTCQAGTARLMGEYLVSQPNNRYYQIFVCIT